MKIYAIFILAHLLADFLFQPDSLIKLKESNHKKGMFWNKGIFWHSLIQFGTMLILLLIYAELRIETLLAALCVFVCHYLIDRFKFQCKNNEIWKFVLDQLLHAGVIYLTLWGFQLVTPVQELAAYLVAFGRKAIPISLRSKFLLEGIALIGLILVSGQFIKIVLDKLKLNPFVAKLSYPISHTTSSTIKQKRTPDKLEPRTGLYIGWTERALIGIFMLLKIYTGLALLATLKTLARFKQLENRANAEYFILGSLLSILLGVFFGALMEWIFYY